MRNKSSIYQNDRVVDSNVTPSGNDIFFAKLVFEKDGWPAPVRNGHITVALANRQTRTIKWQYRSWQTEYDKSYTQSTPTHTIDNIGVKYNFKYKY